MKRALLLSLVLLVSGTAFAQRTTCPDHFVNGSAPVFINPSLSVQTHALCFEGFADMYSGVSRTPLWAAEHLTRAHLEEARGLKRHNAFHPEPRLPRADRADLADYARSGYDRGHMAPSGDMPTKQAQYESFSLANIVPQDPNNNEILWEGIEAAVRTLASERGELYVITGPLFEGAQLKRLNGRVLVPTAVFKAVYDPVRHEAGAYIAPNAPGMDYESVSIAALERRLGIDLFPSLPQAIKETPMRLPRPTPHGQRPRTRHRVAVPYDVPVRIAVAHTRTSWR